jgi:hypothetical protein
MAPESRLCPECGKTLAWSSRTQKWYCPGFRTGCTFRPVRNLQRTNKLTATTIQPLANPSPEQQAIFTSQLTSNYNTMILALAGTGKTTALLQLVKIYTDRNLSVCCLAFAGRDKKTLEARCGGAAKVYTSNGAGLGILSGWARKQNRRLDVKNDAAYQMLFARCKEDGLIEVKDGKQDWKMSYHVFSTVLGLVDKARTILALRSPSKPSEQDWRDLAERFDYEISNDAWVNVLFYSAWLFGEMANLNNILIYGVDFAGQVFLPVYHSLSPSITYDRVLVDECQDQSFVNREIARLYCKGKLVAVGDKYQAIYGWRGADSDAVDEMRQLMGEPEQFPLTLCRRCSKAVIADAQALVPAIQALPEAPQGQREHIPESQLFDRLATERKGLVLCRANAPLISLCLKLLAKRIPATLARSNIVSDLLRMVDNLSEHNDALSVTDLLATLSVYEAERLAKFAKANGRGATKAQILSDKANCIRVLAENVATAGDLKKLINELFPLHLEKAENGEQPADRNIILSTIHGAKGGEANTVYLLSPESYGISLFDQVWSGEQDRDNTLYVAITRARHTLVYAGIMPTLKPFHVEEETDGEHLQD